MRALAGLVERLHEFLPERLVLTSPDVVVGYSRDEAVLPAQLAVVTEATLGAALGPQRRP